MGYDAPMQAGRYDLFYRDKAKKNPDTWVMMPPNIYTRMITFMTKDRNEFSMTHWDFTKSIKAINDYYNTSKPKENESLPCE